jgi:WD40 repeat protein
LSDPASIEDEARGTPAAGADGFRFDVFLSHHGSDKGLVERIAERLKRARLEPWLDAWQLVPGVDWQRGLADGLAASRSCAVFVGRSDLGAWTNQEVAVALDRGASDPGFRLFLVLLPGLPERFDAAGLSPFLRMRTWVDYRGGLEDERAFRALVSAIKGLPLGPSVPIEADTGECPYRGLEVFDEAHAEFFFGRDADVQRLLEQLKGTRFVAVLGASGSGKSSLVRAGLVPALRQQATAAKAQPRIVVVRPGARPLETLAAQLLRLGGGGPMQQTLDGLAADARTLHLAVSLALAGQAPGVQAVLVVDQFEEVFTLCHSEDERRAFFSNLLYAATIPDGNVVVVLTMRADFYHRCGAYPELAQQLGAHQYLVSPLQRDGLRQAVEEPARRVGLAFEPGLVATILADVVDRPGALPLLEHALLELWRRRSAGMLTLAGYQESGGVQGAIAKRADELFESLDPGQQELARRTFVRLTQPGEGTEDTRRRAELAEVGGADVGPVVARLVDARLLTTSRDEAAGSEVIEVAHEALIRGWPRLRGWLDQDRVGLLIHRRLTESAREWERLGRDEGGLYRGPRLVEALEWRKRGEGELDDVERAFLDRSVALREHERRRARVRVLTLVAVLALGFVVSAAGAVIALGQRNEAREQQALANSRELAVSAQAALENDPARSMEIALEALDMAETEEAWHALRAAVSTSSLAAAVPSETPFGGVLSPDNRFLAVLGGKGTLWRTADWTRIDAFGSTPTICAEFSPNSKLLATTNTSGTRIRSTTTGRETLRLPQASCPIFSPDSELVASAGEKGLVVRRAETGKVLATLDRESQLGSLLAFSPDGTFLVYGRDGQTRVWRTATWQPVTRPPQALLRTAALSSRIPYLVNAARGGAAVVVERRTGVQLARFPDDSRWTSGTRPSDPGTQLGEVTLSPDGRFMIDARNSDVVELRTGRVVAEVRGIAQFTPDSRLFLEQTGPETIAVIDVATWSPIAELRGEASFGGTEDLGPSLAFSPDGAFAITSGDRAVRIWDLPVASGRVEVSRFDTVWDAAFGRGGVAVLVSVGGTSEQLGAYSRLWRASWTPRSRGLPVRPSPELTADALSPDGTLALALIGASELRDARTGKLVIDLGDEWTSAEFSPNGNFLLTRDAGSGSSSLGVDREQLAVWNTRAGRRVADLGERIAQTAEELAVSSDGRRVAVAGSAGTTVWTTNRRRLLGPVPGGSARGVWFSPDGAHVTTAFDDQRAVVLPTTDSDSPVTLRSNGPIEDLSFSPDSRFVALAGADGTARIWTATGESVATLRGHTAGLRGVRFAPDGRHVLTVGADGTVRVQRCDACVTRPELRAFARGRTKHLPEAERT